MKYATLFAVVLACTMASSISIDGMKAINKQFKNVVSAKPKDILRNAIMPKEDIKMCGTYETECMATPFLSVKASMKILGMLHHDPIYISYPVTAYIGSECTEETNLMTNTLMASLSETKSIEKKLTVHVEKFMILFHNPMGISAYTCKEPLEVDVNYDVTTLDCKDQEGNDPFADSKAMIGTTIDSVFIFSENAVDIPDDEGNVVRLNRLNDEGCTCYKTLINKMKKSITQFSHVTPKQMMMRSMNLREDIKYCGLYEGECIPDEIMAFVMGSKILGMTHKVPIYMRQMATYHIGSKCTDDAKLMGMAVNASMKEKNGITKTMVLGVEKVFITFYNEMIVSSLKCSEPVKIDEEYDVMTLDCKDDAGEDMFAFAKEMIGQSIDTQLTFNENSLEIYGDDSSKMVMKRIDEDGCNCAQKGRRGVCYNV